VLLILICMLVKLALQLGNNDIHAAHECLATLSKSPQYIGLDRELTELTRVKLEKANLIPKLPEVHSEPEKREKQDVVMESVKEAVDPILEAVNTGKLMAKQEPIDEEPKVPTGGPPFLAGLMKATAARRSIGTLHVEPAIHKDEAPRPPLRGPSFLAGLGKATEARKNRGVLPDERDDNEIERDAPPPRVPAFLAGLSKATAGRKNICKLPAEDDESNSSKAELKPLETPLIGNLAKINPNPPPAPPFPEHLRPARSPFGDSLASNIDLSIADDFSRTPSPPLPPAPPIPGFLSKPAASEPARHRIKNALHWDEIRGEEKIRNTVWSELQTSMSVESEQQKKKVIDVHRFEELFCVNPVDDRSKANKKVEQAEVIPKYALNLP